MNRAEDIYLTSDRREEVIYANIQNDFGGFYLARRDLEGAKIRYGQPRVVIQRLKEPMNASW
jgi:hypothetical protein